MMQAWDTWFGSLGDALVDPGAPFGQRQTIAGDGTVSETGIANGYCVIEAADLSEATTKSKGCPVLSLGAGNTVEVSEFLDMG